MPCCSLWPGGWLRLNEYSICCWVKQERRVPCAASGTGICRKQWMCLLSDGPLREAEPGTEEFLLLLPSRNFFQLLRRKISEHIYAWFYWWTPQPTSQGEPKQFPGTSKANGLCLVRPTKRCWLVLSQTPLHVDGGRPLLPVGLDRCSRVGWYRITWLSVILMGCSTWATKPSLQCLKTAVKLFNTCLDTLCKNKRRPQCTLAHFCWCL